MSFEVFTWFLTIFAVTGVVLNIYKKKACFYIWTFTNFSWSVIDFEAGIHAQGALFFIYFLLALWGIYKWSTDEGA